MKHLGIYVWLIATVLLITAFTVTYKNKRNEYLSTVYVCYTFILDQKGNTISHDNSNFTREVLENIKSGDIFNNYKISSITNTERSFYAKYEPHDNPSIGAGRLQCYVK